MNREPSSPAVESRWMPLALAVGLTLVFFHRAVFSADVFFLRDLQQVYLPLREYWKERVLAGSFPEWYPFDALGEPYVGMVISGAFHPSHLLSLVMPGPQALKASVLLCFPVAFLGMDRLARRLGLEAAPALLAAVLYTFSGYLVGITNNPLYLTAAATVPWVLWALEGLLAQPTPGRALGTAVLLTLVLFTGDVQAYGVTFGLVLLWSGCRLAPGARSRAGGLALGVLGLSVLLSAVQILPTLNVLSSVRASGQTVREATVWSVHPLRLLELFLGPLFSGAPGDEVQQGISLHLLSLGKSSLWVDSLFIGAPALLLAGLAGATQVRRPRTLLLAAAALGLLLLALGKHTALYTWVFTLFPPWRTFRYPEKLMPFVTFALALAAGVGLHGLEREPRHRQRLGGLAFALGAGLLGLGGLEQGTRLVCGRWMVGLWEDSPVIAQAQERIGAAFVEGCVLAGLSLLVLGGILTRGPTAQVRAWLTGALCFVGLWLANGSLYKVGDPALFELPPPFVQRIQEEARGRPGEPIRVFRLPSTVVPPTSGPGSPEETSAFVNAAALEPLTPARYGLESAGVSLPAASQRVISLWNQQLDWAVRDTRLFNTRYLVLSREYAPLILSEQRRVLSSMDALGLLLVEDTGALPRVYLAHPRCVGRREEAVRPVGRALETPPEALLECASPLPEAPAGAPVGEVLSAHFAPERVEVDLRAVGGEVLVLNDAFFEGWSASVDGAPAPILPANGAVRAVPVPPGAHRVLFVFRTPGLALGAGVSGGTLLLGLLAAGLWERLRGRRASPTAAAG